MRMRITTALHQHKGAGARGLSKLDGCQLRMHTLYIPHHDPPCLLMQVVGEIVGVAGGMDGVGMRMYKRLHNDEMNVTKQTLISCDCHIDIIT